MDFKEGQIYEGNISISGGDGPKRRWIVISPFGKTHIHSIDNHSELHCWPLPVLSENYHQGSLRLIETDTEHPVIQLQRAKEKLGIKDSHMGLHDAPLDRMIELLEQAALTDQAYTPFAAGEIIAFMDRAQHSKEESERVKKQVDKYMQIWESQSGTDNAVPDEAM